MTLAAERAKSAQALEWLLAIEGVGWPRIDGNATSYFDGALFTSADQLGTLASCFTAPVTLKSGLVVASTIEESLDPRTLDVHVGAMTLDLLDATGYLLANFSPHRTGNYSTLYATLSHASTTIDITDGTNFLAGDLVWLFGRELVVLGTKSAISGTAYRFTGSTRGHLGTHRGRVDVFGRGGGELEWKGGTAIDATPVNSVRRFWRDSRVQLLAHVPGEVDRFEAVWRGRIRGVKVPDSGDKWSLSCVGETTLGLDVRRRLPAVEIVRNAIVSAHDVAIYSTSTRDNVNLGARAPTVVGDPSNAGLWRREIELRAVQQDQQGVSEAAGPIPIAASYQYRTEPGGTSGIADGAVPVSSTIQALDSTEDVDVNFSLLAVGDHLMRILKRSPTHVYTRVIAEMTADWLGQYNLDLIPDGALGRVLLDNYSNVPEISRFAVNGQVMRHPIDVAIAFLTTMPGEYWRADATGGTASSPAFASIAAPFASKTSFDGVYALHCVEGVNKGQARSIVRTTATEVLVDPPFPSAPGAGDEYQIRNSLWDILPLGWGLGLPASRIDLASFVAIRDELIPTARIGRFALGAQGEIDLYALVRDCLLKPFGVAIYVDHVTGKMTALHVGEVAQDGLLETLPTLTQGEIFQIGELDFNVSKPIGLVNVNVRTTESKLLRYTRSTWSALPGYTQIVGEGVVEVERDIASSDPTQGELFTIPVKAENIEDAIVSDGFDTLTVEARMNTADDCEHIVTRAIGLLRRYVAPPPTLTLFVDTSKHGVFKLGQPIKITDTRIIDPYAGTRGVSGMLARVLSVRHPTMTGGNYLAIGVQLLGTYSLAKLAPAAIITAATYDGGLLKWYLTVENRNFVANQNESIYSATDRDWYYFAVNDNVRVYDRTGLAKGNARRIVYFGSNQSSTPQGASDSRVYLDGDPGITYAAQDYVSFDEWGASTGAERQANYSHLADASGYVYTTTVAAKVYA